MKQKQTEPEQQGVQHQTLDKESAPEAGKQTTSPGAQFDTHPHAHLWQVQRAFGNRYTQRLIQNSPPIQARFKSDSQNDMSESEVPPITSETIQKKENRTGLPDILKMGIENLSGYSLDDVTVHYNSNKPAQLQAHAYAQGTEIHLAAGQEKHLPHEAWHVVQQKQGQVRPTIQANGLAINDDSGLEREADNMGKIIVRQTCLLDNKSLTNSSKVEGPMARQQLNHYVASSPQNTPMQFKVKAGKLNIVGEDHIKSNQRRAKEKDHAMGLFPNQEEFYWLENMFRHEPIKNTQADVGAFADPSAIVAQNSLLERQPDDKGYGDPFDLRIRAYLLEIDHDLTLLKETFEDLKHDQQTFLKASKQAYDFLRTLMELFKEEKITAWDNPFKYMKKWFKKYKNEKLPIKDWEKNKRETHSKGIDAIRANYIFPLLNQYGMKIADVLQHNVEIDKLTLARSVGMISAANESKKIGVWKVGDTHAKQIKHEKINVQPDEHVEVTLQEQYDEQLKNERVENEGEHNNNL